MCMCLVVADCSVGKTYAPDTPVYAISGWYLDLEQPATCSGNITKVTIYHYNHLLSWKLLCLVGSVGTNQSRRQYIHPGM